MDIQQIIDEITTTECVNCKFGKALIALKSLRDDHAPDEKNTPPAAPKIKLQRKTAKVKKTPSSSSTRKTGNKRSAILEYLQQHSGSGAVAIAKALGFSRSATTWNLAEARDAGLVRIDGRSSSAKWSLVNQKSTQRIPPPEPREEDEPESGLACKFCHAPCASPERLERHMKIVHGKTI